MSEIARCTLGDPVVKPDEYTVPMTRSTMIHNLTSQCQVVLRHPLTGDPKVGGGVKWLWNRACDDWLVISWLRSRLCCDTRGKKPSVPVPAPCCAAKASKD